jgi:signal transduction histidine kinase
VDRLSKIVETLLAISRLEAGEAQREWARFDLAKLAASTADQMALLAEDKGVSVTCEAQGGVSVEGDQARIKQVVVNLLDNAIKYTPSGGTVRLDVRARDDKAVMEVSDTGIGIPASSLPHVFERFFRVDEARSRTVDGTGLGLAIVKSICTAHGGRVEVESLESHGSRFRVELPLSIEQKKQEQTAVLFKA